MKKLMIGSALFASMMLIPGLSATAAEGMRYEIAESTGNSGAQTSLLETVKSVLSVHKGLKSIQENREVAVHELRASKAGYGPRIDVTASAGYSYLNDSSARQLGEEDGMNFATSVGVLLTQPIWDGLATYSRVRASEGVLESASNRVINNATTLALDGLIAHVDLIWRRETLRLSEQNVEVHREILQATQDRQATGVDTMANVTQAQGRLSQALSSLTASRSSLVEGEASYRRLTERPVPVSLEAVPQPKNMYNTVEDVLAIAQANNPELKAYLADVRTAQGEKGMAAAAYSPVINLEVGPSYSNRENVAAQWVASFDAMATASWNIFNSGADVAANKAAAARVREYRQTAMSYLDDLRLQVQNTWTQYQTAVEQLALHEESYRYNVQTRDFYMEQFLLGQRTLLDVLDAESEVFNTATQAVTARANIVITSYRLFALAGMLMPELGISPESVLVKPETVEE